MMKKPKNVLAVVLAVLLTLSSGAGYRAAGEDAPAVIASGECGHDNPADLTWRLTDDGALTIEGTGEINHEKIPDIWPYVDLVRNVTVGEGVTNLLSFLDGCMALETVTLPASLKYDITYFTNTPRQFFVDPASPYFAVGPDGCLYNKDLTTFFKYAGGSERTEYTLPEHTIHVRHGAFIGAEYLTKIVLHDNLAELSYNMFRACTALEEVTLPAHAVQYAGHLFYECTSLKSFEIPDWMTEIPFEMFSGCTALESVEIPDTVTDVDGGAFYACVSLREIDLPAGLEILRADVVGRCASLTALKIPAGVKTIQQYACSGCTALETVNIPAGVTAIEKNAFRNCGSLRDVTIEMPPAQWAQVEIAEGNEDLLNATLHFVFPHEHDFRWAASLLPTCTEPGREVYACTVCGLADSARDIPPEGHKWDAGTVITEPAAHAPGEIKYQCLACGASCTADVAPAGTHDWKAIPVSDAGLKKGRCWLDLTADAALAGSSGGAWYADYDTCVLRHDTADGTAYYGADVFVRCVREVGVTWQPAATSTNGLADGDWYVDTAALIEAVGGDKTEAEKREAKELLETCFRFFVNPGGNLYQIRYEYADLPDGSGGKISGSVDFPLSLLAGEEDAFSYDYETLRQCIRQYEAAAPDPGQGEDDANGGVFSGIVAFVKGAISAILSFFRRLFKTYK